MFWLIENKKQLQQFKEKKFKKVFIEPLFSNDNQHPFLRDVVGFYIREINHRKGFIININHSEATSCELSEVLNLIGGFEEIFVTYSTFKAAFRHTLHFSYGYPRFVCLS